MKTLHILNGDATHEPFEQSGIAGEVMVWREVLSEGPLPAGSERDFFAARCAWICEAFPVTPGEYEAKTLNGLHVLDRLDHYDEIVLWFEFDLHCQANLLYLLQRIARSVTAARVCLVCPSHHPNHLDFRGLGQLNGAELAMLYAERTCLHPADLAFAREAWQVYISNDPEQITAFLQRDFGNLPALKPAMAAHLDRFPDEHGLGIIERKLIGIVHTGLTRNKDIYREFWKTTAIYGMGDAEVDIYLRKLMKEGRINGVIFV